MKCDATEDGAQLHVDGRLVFSRIVRPKGLWARARGLVGYPVPALGEAWLFEGCNCIHMFGMRYPIDVVFIDQRWRVLSIRAMRRPWGVVGCRGAAKVIEIRPGGAVEAGLVPGMIFQKRGTWR